MEPDENALGAMERAFSSLTISQVVEFYYQGSQRMLQFADEVMLPLMGALQKPSDREVAFLGTYYRMAAWVRSLIKLNNAADYQATAAGARTIYELYLDVMMLRTTETDLITQRFHAFAEIRRFQAAKTLVDFVEKNQISTIEIHHQRNLVKNLKVETEMRQKVVDLWGIDRKGEPKWPEHWTGKKVKERAEFCGANSLSLYMEMYPTLSWHIHAGPTGYYNLSPETIESIVALSHDIAQKAFLEATEECAKELMISDAVPNFATTLNALRCETDNLILHKGKPEKNV